MGLGIWSMHYVGMLAFVLPVPVLYHWPTVLASLLAAVFASGVALVVVSRREMDWGQALAGSESLWEAASRPCINIGMEAMRFACNVPATIRCCLLYPSFSRSRYRLWPYGSHFICGRPPKPPGRGNAPAP